MRIFNAFLLLVAATGVTSSKANDTVSPSKEASASAISQELYDSLAFYFKYAANAYAISCPNPLGNHLVLKFNHLLSDTQGYIARDDTRKEIVVAFRGSTSPKDFLTDASILLVPFLSRGVNAPGKSFSLHHLQMRFRTEYLQRTFESIPDFCAGMFPWMFKRLLLSHPHTIFTSWNSLATKIISTVEFELTAHPGYTIVTSGHSLGGALSSVAGIALRENFPKVYVP
ncbi:hypothetical protein DXG03_004823 [Asterophora parasitica]|uniref:Fungal lipase-type domain-containing protein n=1 Tax=Asterophora parasitica TaxID=117018 RepID=A0A9P7K8U7_9AGAR|nr:hypothetical protein DXG03_004823 [Asterophora parasitica]